MRQGDKKLKSGIKRHTIPRSLEALLRELLSLYSARYLAVPSPKEVCERIGTTVTISIASVIVLALLVLVVALVLVPVLFVIVVRITAREPFGTATDQRGANPIWMALGILILIS